MFCCCCCSDNLSFTITRSFSLYCCLLTLCQSCLHIKYQLFFAAGDVSLGQCFYNASNTRLFFLSGAQQAVEHRWSATGRRLPRGINCIFLRAQGLDRSSESLALDLASASFSEYEEYSFASVLSVGEDTKSASTGRGTASSSAASAALLVALHNCLAVTPA